MENHIKGAGSAVVAMIFLYYTCYNLAWSGLLIGYTVEILPFEIRARGKSLLAGGPAALGSADSDSRNGGDVLLRQHRVVLQ